MKIDLFIRAVLLWANLYILVNGRSLKKVQHDEVDILSDEDSDIASTTKSALGSQMSFIEEFLALATDDGEKTQQKEEEVEVNERYDKIFWTDDELYQLKVISDDYLLKESPSKPRLQQFHNSEASKNLAAIKGMESREASLVERSRIETPASDRQMEVRETVSREVVEERYTQLVLALPARIEEAEVAMVILVEIKLQHRSETSKCNRTQLVIKRTMLALHNSICSRCKEELSRAMM